MARRLSRVVAAIHYGLCGRVKKRGRGVDPVERYRPWDAKGRGFRLSLTLKLESGHTLEVNQNLDEPGRSRVVDVDLAGATANLARARLAVDAGIAVLSQANVQPALALRLLQ